MTPTEADIEAVVDAEEKGTRLYPEQVVDGLPTIYSSSASVSVQAYPNIIP